MEGAIKVNIPSIYTLPTIDFVGGATQELVFHCYFHENKRPFDLYQCTANFSLINYVNKNGTPRISKQMEIRQVGTEDGDIANILAVTLTSSDTVELEHGKYIYQITICGPNNTVDIPDQGIIYIVNNINKAYIQ